MLQGGQLWDSQPGLRGAWWGRGGGGVCGGLSRPPIRAN